MKTLQEMAKIEPTKGKIYLSRKDFKDYVSLVSPDDSALFNAWYSKEQTKKRYEAILKEGKGIYFRGYEVIRI